MIEYHIKFTKDLGPGQVFTCTKLATSWEMAMVLYQRLLTFQPGVITNLRVIKRTVAEELIPFDV